jgi:hypothetical protein
MFYLDITKGSPNYTFQGWHFNSTASYYNDYTFQTFLDGMEQVSGAPSVLGQAFVGGTATGAAVSEATGVFNTLDICWNSASFPLEIYGMAVYRIT